jgi:membrane associated rhomboid family serine protease
MTNGDDEDDPKIKRFPKPGEPRPVRHTLRTPPPVANDVTPERKWEPIFNLPPVVQALCLILLGIAIVMAFLSHETAFTLSMDFGFISGRFTRYFPMVPEAWLSPVTHLFIHGGWLHVGVNVGMLMAFGSALERAIGGRMTLLLFFLSGFAGALTHFVIYPASIAPLIGASGAISGLFGGVLMIMHRQGMMGQGHGYRRLFLFAAVWIGISMIFGYTGMPGAGGNIAWTAHVGGFIGGMIFFHVLVRGPVSFR